MEVELVYFGRDPRHAQARAFVKDFIRERGILANVIETEKPVRVPTITVNGCEITAREATQHSDDPKPGVFPSLEDISQALERGFWCL